MIVLLCLFCKNHLKIGLAVVLSAKDHLPIRSLEQVKPRLRKKLLAFLNLFWHWKLSVADGGMLCRKTERRRLNVERLNVEWVPM